MSKRACDAELPASKRVVAPSAAIGDGVPSQHVNFFMQPGVCYSFKGLVGDVPPATFEVSAFGGTIVDNRGIIAAELSYNDTARDKWQVYCFPCGANRALDWLETHKQQQHNPVYVFSGRQTISGFVNRMMSRNRKDHYFALPADRVATLVFFKPNTNEVAIHAIYG